MQLEDYAPSGCGVDIFRFLQADDSVEIGGQGRAERKKQLSSQNLASCHEVK